MIGHNRIGLIPIKTFLYLAAGVFAVAAALLIFVTTSAQTGATGGDSPSFAAQLGVDGNKGTLNPGEQHWYSFTADGAGGQYETSFSLIFTRDDGNIIRFVELNLFHQDQAQYFNAGDTSRMTIYGSAQVTALDANPETGERYWRGSVASGNTYYIQVANNSDFPINYLVYRTDVTPPPVAQPEAAEAPPATGQQENLPGTAAVPSMGTDPLNPAPMLDGLNTGKLAPKQTYWYSFRKMDYVGDKRFTELDYTLFFTPDDGHRRHQVNFELYPFSETEIWRRGDGDKMTNFGAGMMVSRDGDYNTGERIWRGVVVSNDSYLLAVRNGTDVEIDYYLFDGDIYHPELGPKTVPAPPPVFAPGEAPTTAKPLQVGLNKGGLDPGEEAWFSFRITDFDDQQFEEMGLTMIATPDDGNLIRDMTFDVFTAQGAKDWSQHDNSRINNFGAGSVVYRDDNPLTGERFWSGWVVDNDLYYVQIRNNTPIHMDYWLYTGDVYRPELGDKLTPVIQQAQAAPGTAPSAPLPLQVGVNTGQLGPKQERWYLFTRGDVNQTGSVDTALTLVFTPDDGNRIRDIHLDLFEGNQLQAYSAGNPDGVQGFGQAAVVNRDGNVQTGERVWKGQVLGGNYYYMRVLNNSDVTIDYSIFPDDVVNTDLTQ